jgi:hypothetical protein
VVVAVGRGVVRAIGITSTFQGYLWYRHGSPYALAEFAILEKNDLKPWQTKQWCLPEVRAEFVAAMEDGLDLYEEPYDPQRPKVNCTETSKPLLAETQGPLPCPPGKAALYDYEYQRHGTRNRFMCCAPQAGWRHIAVTEYRPMQDFAHQMPWLVDERYPEAEGLRVVLDNLNTHNPASLSETFAPAEARRLLKKLEFHYPPKHGSWLNRAEIELSILQRQCLDRRIADEATLTREIAAYAEARNTAQATIVWRFTTTKAREKLHRLYPSNSK